MSCFRPLPHHFWCALIFALTLAIPSTSSARTCAEFSSDSFLNCPDGANCWFDAGQSITRRLNYYVESSMASAFRACTPTGGDSALTDTELRSVIHTAANIFNESASATPLVYRGSLSGYDDYNLATICDNVEKPAIYIHHKYCGGTTSSSCTVGGIASVFDIEHPTNNSCDGVIAIGIYSNKVDPAGCSHANSVDWRLGSQEVPATNPSGGYKVPFLGIMVHEFGHALGMAHSELVSEENSVMYDDFSAHGWPDIAQKRPHLWPYDRECLNPGNEQRGNQYRWVRRTGSPTTWTSANTSQSFTSKMFFSGGYFSDTTSTPQYGYFDDTALIYGTAPTRFSSESFVNLSGSNLPQYPSNMPVLFSPIENGSYHDMRANYLLDQASYDPPLVKYSRTSNMFDSSINGTYRECLNSTCSSSSNVSSHMPMTATQDPYSGNTVHAQVITTRPYSDLAYGRIKIYPGFHTSGSFISPNKLRTGSILPNTNLPTNTSNWSYQAETNFAPGIACAPNRNTWSYNCLVAWHDKGALNGSILYRYFRINSSNQIEWHSTTYRRSGAYTESSVSAAFANGRFWLGWKTRSYPRRIQAVESKSSGYASWESTDSWQDIYAVSPPAFLYRPSSTNDGAMMMWQVAGGY